MKKNKPKPPGIILWLLSKLKRYEQDYSSCGDFIEYHSYLYESEKWLKATFLCWMNILVLMTGYFFKTLKWKFIILKENMKIAVRSFKKSKTYSMINLTGLTIGMVCFILIMLWVKDELSYNQFHKNIDNIYWMSEWVNHNNVSSNCYGSVTAAAPTLKEKYPEVKNYARCMNGSPRFLIAHEDKSYFENIKFGDFSFFEIFTFPVVMGNAMVDRSDSNVIMISQKTAGKYFPDKNPVGEILTLDHKHDLRVVGVFENIKRTSTIQFDLIVPLEMIDKLYGTNYSFNWKNDSNQTYLLLEEGVDCHQFNLKIRDFYKNYKQGNQWPVTYPFKKLYLERWGWGRKRMVHTFFLVAILVLLIACVNFINLSTARSVKRAKEIGLRKVIGARRDQLIKQFLVESTCYSFVAVLFALLIVIYSLPFFGDMISKPITIKYLFNFKLLGGIAAITILTGLLSGIYPAFVLSSFRLSNVLKGTEYSSLRSQGFRKIMVIGQFGISIVLITCSLIIFKQISYLQNADWGFEKEGIVHFRLEGNHKKNYLSLKNELERNPKLLSVTAATHTPGGVWAGQSGWEWEGKDPKFHLWSRVFSTDQDFLKTFNLKMTAGKFFQHTGTNKNRVVINETFARKMNLENPVGVYIREKSINDNQPSEIIGVIKDFHIAPLKTKIAPLIIFPGFRWGDIDMKYNHMFIKIMPSNVSASIAFIEKCVKKHNPNFPFNCQFYNTHFENLYNEEKILDKVIRFFTALAIIISCLGLFGLASFSSEKRRKEIGIRKVLGASVTGIMALLSKQFLKLVAVSNIVAIPVAYFFISNWLNNFAYKITPEILLFIIPGLASFLIALVTISYQTIRAANANPVQSIKCE